MRLRNSRMIEKTKMKLEEARFFQRRLIECRKQPLSLEPNAFQFYLSAFMQAARTVPWRLKKEEKKKISRLASDLGRTSNRCGNRAIEIYE
jgi:hypothetical protein